MKNEKLQFDADSFINYKYLIYFFIEGQNNNFYGLLKGYFFEKAIHEYFEIKLTSNEEIYQLNNFTQEERERMISTLFGADTLEQYKTVFFEEITQLEEDTYEEENIWDYFHPNVLDFETNLVPVLPLEAELVPEPLREYAVQSSSSMDKSPLDFIVVSMLTCLGALLGNSVRIQPKIHALKWLIPPNLWTVIIGVPSSKKTPSMNYALSLLSHAIERVLDVQNRKQQLEYKAKLSIHEAKVQNYKQSIAKATKNDDDEQSKTLAEKLALLEKPTMTSRDFVVNDATQEALALKLSQNKHGLLSVRDELSGWLEAMNKPNQSHARAFNLETFNGSKNYSVERISSETFNIELMLTSVLGGLQPSKLSPLLKDRDEGISDDGLIERLLQFAVQPDFDGSEYTDDPVPPEFEEKAQKIFELVAKLSLIYESPLIFSYSNEAQVEWDRWANEHAKKVRVMDDSMQAIYGKQAATCAKLILLFHIINEIDKPDVDLNNLNTSIEVESLTMGFRWIMYLDSHIDRILNFVTQDKKYIPARDMLEKMSKLPDEFTVKNISDKGWSTFKKAKIRDDALAVLVEHNYLTLNEEKSGTRIKRIYSKHPSIMN